MHLSDLLSVLPEQTAEGPVMVADIDAPVITGLRYDSRQVVPGDLFFAWHGAQSDGHRFIADACRRGAAAVILETVPTDLEGPSAVPFIRVPDARRALTRVAGAFYGHPSRQLSLVGITGTNGKTTTAFLLQYLLRALHPGVPVGLIGTVRYDVGNALLPAPRTTPEGADLQALLAQMVGAGCRSAVMEVSSHALDQGRVEDLPFAVGVFTNLTPDHLDYHSSMEEYFQAKRRLFTGPARCAVLNLDDPFGHRLNQEVATQIPTLTYSAEGKPHAALRAEAIHSSGEGTTFTLLYKTERFPIQIPLVGRFNVANLLAALGAALSLGMELTALLPLLPHLPSVPGRLERFGGGSRPTVIVDYAHTEDALRKALTTLRELQPQRLFAVVGCGGNRDKTKRPQMASTALQLADHVYFTADNPRNEPQAEIFHDMRTGVPAEADCDWIEDRREAIVRAIAAAVPGDLVCIAGKGHESTQEIAGHFHPFRDQEVVLETLASETLAEGRA